MRRRPSRGAGRDRTGERAWRTEVARTVTAVDLAASDPDALAARWARVLDLPPDACSGEPPRHRPRSRHAPVPSRRRAATAPYVVGYDIAVTDPIAVREAAAARGLATSEDAVTIAGNRLGLVS